MKKIGVLLWPIKLAWIKFWAWFDNGPLWQASTAWYFVQLALKAGLGQIIIISAEPMRSKGGYRYMGLILSKRPVSAAHTYGDLGLAEPPAPESFKVGGAKTE